MLGEDSDLKEKFQEFELKLEQLKEEIDAASEQQIVADVEQGFSDVGGSGGEQLFKIHWIEISETSFEECEDVESTEDAQKAFREAAIERGVGMQNEEVLHGDLMVLLCNSAKEVDEGTGEITYTDSCYYIGMCINTDNTWHQDENPQGGIKIGDSHTVSGDSTLRQFIAWNSCGDSCPEEPEKLVLDEFKEPESGGEEEQVDSIKIVSPFGSTLTAKADELQSMTFKKKEAEPSAANNDPPATEYVMFKDGEPSYEDGSTTKPLTGSLFKFSHIINEATDEYDVTANVNRVSLSSSSATIQDIKLNAKTYDLQKLDITSDSCGSLKREKAKDEDDVEIPPEKIKLLQKSDQSGSQHTISSLNVVEGSEEVSLGNLDLQSLLVTEDLFMDGGNKDKYFFTPSITLADGDKIRKSEEIELLKDFKIEVTQESVGENCTTITITPSTKKETYTFKSGLLTEKTNEDEWVAGTSSNFTFQNCMAGCDASLTISPPNVFVATSALVGLPQGGNNEKPNCASAYSASRSVTTEPGTVYENSWSFSVTKKQLVGGDYFNILTYQEKKISPYTGSGSAGWDSRECIITWRMPYDDQGEPAEQLNGTGKGVYTIVSSRKEEYIGDNPEKVTENFYSSNITVT